jgi:hypothetical protein
MPAVQTQMALRSEFEGDRLHPTGKGCRCAFGDKVVA